MSNTEVFQGLEGGRAGFSKAWESHVPAFQSLGKTFFQSTICNLKKAMLHVHRF
jgi:hypothetical protein